MCGKRFNRQYGDLYYSAFNIYQLTALQLTMSISYLIVLWKTYIFKPVKIDAESSNYSSIYGDDPKKVETKAINESEMPLGKDVV